MTAPQRTYPARLSQLPTPDECRTHARDRDGAMSVLSWRHHAAVRRGVLAWMAGEREILRSMK